MIKPMPYKKKCPKCGYSGIVRPDSDVCPSGNELKFLVCPKCGEFMVRTEPNWLDKLLNPDLVIRKL